MKRITTTSPRWSLKTIGCYFFWLVSGQLSLAIAWQDSGFSNPLLEETAPRPLFGPTSALLAPGDSTSVQVVVNPWVSPDSEDMEDSHSTLIQIAQSLQLPTSTEPQTESTLGGNDGQSETTQSETGSSRTAKQFFYKPALPFLGSDGNLYLKPNLKVEGQTAQDTSVFSSYESQSLLRDYSSGVDEYVFDSVTQSNYPSTLSTDVGDYAGAREYTTRRRPRRVGGDLGIGHERLPFALSQIDASQPFNNIRIRSDFQYGWHFPNRAEYLWAGPSKGPRLPESGLDLQEYSLLMETATDSFSVGTELPLIWLNPTINPNTSGFGDMSVTTKLVLLKGQSLQLTQITRTHMPTGQASSGRGNGHVSMEPGLVARYTRDERTMFHGMFTFLFPIGGDPNFSGEVLEYSFGVARVWYDSDQFAIIPTIESVNWAVLSGAKGIEQNKISGDYISNLHPGVRFVFDRGGDLGLFEAGFGTGFSLTDNHFYQSLFRFDLRWSY